MKVKTRPLLVLVTVVLVLAGAAWFAVRGSNELAGGDQDRRILRALRAEATRLTAGLPATTVVTRPPTVDSCDGRDDTRGWTDEAAIVSIPSLDEATREAIESRASTGGWKPGLIADSPLDWRWTKTVAGRPARLLLAARSDNTFVLAVTAQPPGPAASGC